MPSCGILSRDFHSRDCYWPKRSFVFAVCKTRAIDLALAVIDWCLASNSDICWQLVSLFKLRASSRIFTVFFLRQRTLGMRPRFL